MHVLRAKSIQTKVRLVTGGGIINLKGLGPGAYGTWGEINDAVSPSYEDVVSHSQITSCAEQDFYS